MTKSDKYRFQVEIAKALAHKNRMMILEVLMKQELCVADIAKTVGINRSTISKQLSILKNAGLVEERKESTKVYYKALDPYVYNIFQGLGSVVKENLARYQAVSGFIEASDFVPKKSSRKKKSKS